MSSPNLSIIIVSYNTRLVLKKCIDSIFQNTKEASFELIIIDNNSTDGTKEYLKELAESKNNLRVIFNNYNSGFAKANNQAIKVAKAKRVLLLNSDTIVGKGVINKLVNASLKYNDEAILAPRLLNFDKSVQPSCYHFPTIWGAILEFWLGKDGRFSKYYPKGDQSQEVDAAVGAALLIPRDVVERVGFLSEKYFMYFEDLDYCRRAKLINIKVIYLPSVEIVHLHGESGKSLPFKTNSWLTESSKIYHGVFRHFLVNLILWSGQKWRKIKTRTKN